MLLFLRLCDHRFQSIFICYPEHNFEGSLTVVWRDYAVKNRIFDSAFDHTYHWAPFYAEYLHYLVAVDRWLKFAYFVTYVEIGNLVSDYGKIGK